MRRLAPAAHPPNRIPMCGLPPRRASSQQDKIADYVQNLLKQYDSNNDGSISNDEMAKMKSVPKGADADSNGQLSRDELTTYYGGGYKQPSTAPQNRPNPRNRVRA